MKKNMLLIIIWILFIGVGIVNMDVVINIKKF
jgi:hypothetical protein